MDAGMIKVIAVIAGLILVLVIACSGVSAPKWSEAEAIAVVKSTCQVVDCTDRVREFVIAPAWSAEYDSGEKRWAVTLDREGLFGDPLNPIISYVYEDTKTVEWHVNR